MQYAVTQGQEECSCFIVQTEVEGGRQADSIAELATKPYV